MRLRKGILIVMIFGFSLESCQKKVESDDKFLQEFPIKDTPLNEVTGFDNYEIRNPLSQDQLNLLKLHTILNSDDSAFSINYKINFTPDFTTLIISHYANEVELFTTLINYDKDYNILGYLTVAYDEIAEGWVQEKSTIKNNMITVTKMNFSSEYPDSTITHYRVSEDGKITETYKPFEFEENYWYDFKDESGDSEIQLTLYFENGEIKGNYYKILTDEKIIIHAYLTGENIQIVEPRGSEKNTVLEGKITSNAEGEYWIKGDWITRVDKSKRKINLKLTGQSYGTFGNRYAVGLFGTTDEVENFMKKTKNSVLTLDSVWLSKNICYPIAVTIQNQEIKIYNENEFLKNFNEIIDSEFRDRIQNLTPVNLFSNYQGAMLGNGEIWIQNTKESTEENYDYCAVILN